jgi:predicted phage terminase large subunit-like protein
LYIHDVYAKRVPYPQAMQLIQQLHGIHNYSKLFVESNAFQKVIMYMPQLQGLPIVPTVTSKGKEERLIPLSSHFESRRAVLNPAWMYLQSEFFQEWVQFPRSGHDDALDCVEIIARNLLGVTALPEGRGVSVVRKKTNIIEDE